MEYWDKRPESKKPPCKRAAAYRGFCISYRDISNKGVGCVVSSHNATLSWYCSAPLFPSTTTSIQDAEALIPLFGWSLYENYKRTFAATSRLEDDTHSILPRVVTKMEEHTILLSEQRGPRTARPSHQSRNRTDPWHS